MKTQVMNPLDETTRNKLARLSFFMSKMPGRGGFSVFGVTWVVRALFFVRG